MAYRRERDMYPSVCGWLERFLREKHPQRQVKVFDTSRQSLARLIEVNGLMANLSPEWPSWDIHVDIVGFAVSSSQTDLSFVECKNIPITLAHLSQLLGYSRVALPQFSFLISPRGLCDSLRSLLVTYHRMDVLEYSSEKGRFPRSIALSTWDEHASALDHGTMIANDLHFAGRA